MILSFPSLDTLRLVLASGQIPPTMMFAPAEVHFAEDGRIIISSSAKLNKALAETLTKLGVSGLKSAPDPLVPVQHWLEILPLKSLPGPREFSSQLPVLFECSTDDFPALVNEMLRLGNDRQSFCWFQHQGQDRALLRVIGPPYYTLLRALDEIPNARGEQILAYQECAPNVWCQMGTEHPLGNAIKPAEGELLLLSSPRTWRTVPASRFQDIYDALEFPVPPGGEALSPTATQGKLEVPLRLIPANSSEPAELWVLSTNALATLDEFVRDADERLIQRLKFALSEPIEGEPTVVIRLLPSKQPPPALQLTHAIGYRSFWKIPNLFIPNNARLHPLLRRDAVRQLLAPDPDRLVWLAPGESPETFRPCTLSENAFRPLEDWVEYVIQRNAEHLKEWLAATTFDFQSFVCIDQREHPGSGIPPGPRDSQGSQTGSRLSPGSKTSTSTPTKTQTNLIPAGEKPERPESITNAEHRSLEEWRRKREELQEQFFQLDFPMDHPDRVAFWEPLAVANREAGDHAEAIICFLNSAWWTNDPAAIQNWARLDPMPMPQSRQDLDARLQTLEHDPVGSHIRLFIGQILAIALQPDPPTWFRERLPALQNFLESYESQLPVRAVWLLATRLTRLAGADVLGLARVRDRLLQRLHFSGLNAELDLAYFLRTAGLRDSYRMRIVKEQLGELHQLVRTWAEKGVQDKSVIQRTDNAMSLPYIDVVFAYAQARFGETQTARHLVAQARSALKLLAKDQDFAIISDYLMDAFQYRVEQALNGQQAMGSLSPELLEELEQIHKKGPASSQSNSAYSMAHYAITRMFDISRIIAPLEKFNPYSEYMKHGDDFKKLLAKLPRMTDPLQLSRALRDLLKSATGKAHCENRLQILVQGLPLAPRVSEVFSVELLKMVPETFLEACGVNFTTEPTRFLGLLLERGLALCGHYDQRDLARQITFEFVQLVRTRTETIKIDLVNFVASECLRSLKKLGMRDEVDRLLVLLQEVVSTNQTLAEVREKYVSRPDQWAKILRSLLSLATGWLAHDLKDRAEAILSLTRKELQSKVFDKLDAKDLAPVIQNYISALAHLDASLGIKELLELFRSLDPKRITNKFTTAKFYSRLHLQIAEEVVFALVGDDSSMSPSSRKWLDEDEMLIRQRIHTDMRAHLTAAEMK